MSLDAAPSLVRECTKSLRQAMAEIQLALAESEAEMGDPRTHLRKGARALRRLAVNLDCLGDELRPAPPHPANGNAPADPPKSTRVSGAP